MMLAAERADRKLPPWAWVVFAVALVAVAVA
jgi:hypothetical protein